MIQYPCGCINEVHSPSGVLRSVSKCKGHRKESRSPEFLGSTYYGELSAIVDGIPQCARYLGELSEALGPFPWKDTELVDDSWALEVGCGASMYMPGLLRAGYRCVGVDENEWAVRWTGSTFAVATYRCPIEAIWAPSSPLRQSWDLILAAHVLEHLEDSPGAIAKLAGMLEPGGELWIIVPDDSDPVNPDHLWFWTESALQASLEAAGLVVDRLEVRKYIEREDFIYCRARRPSV